jgi:hypothetical protein
VFLVIPAYLWVMMILFGAILMETFMVYPNVFHDPPRSLELGLEFMSVRAPSDYGYLADKGSSSAQEESSTRSTIMPSRRYLSLRIAQQRSKLAF